MTALAVLLLQVLACVGFGAVVLRLLRIDRTLQWAERVSWSFVLGIGILGWLIFWLGVSGLFSPLPMALVLIAGVPGVAFLGRPEGLSGAPLSPLELFLLAVLLLALSLDGLEGLSPPADADTLAYHFAIPKLFLQEGRIFFIPRAVDGAAPLLLQMTYGVALGLGGEKALTLWTMVSGWGTALLLFVLARNHMNRAWALAITLIWLTTPAVLYGGGAGQVEVRNAGFALLAVAALMRGHKAGWLRYAALAGLAAGLFMGSKYTGLLFAAAAVGALLTLRRWPLQAVVFGAMALLAGFQWYLWNFLHTGDPVFPMLFPLIGDANYPYWDADHYLAFRNDLFQGERAIPNTPLWMLAYPFLATFATSGAFDSGRAGLGPFLLLILPFAVAGFWRYRRDIATGPWRAPVIVFTLFYVFWFLSGSSQRVRHLVPLYPVVLLVCAYLAIRWTESAKAGWPLYLAGIFTLGIQMAGHGASSLNYARYLFSDETRKAYYERNISGYSAVEWINKNLSGSDKILFLNRQLHYLIDVPSYYAYPSSQVLIDVLPTVDDPKLYYRQLVKQGITHILSEAIWAGRQPSEVEKRGYGLWRVLLANGCAEEVGSVPYNLILSRSLDSRQANGRRQLILKLDKKTCTLK
ncbi:MAG TPA: hypothetical protein ENI55_05565 [Alphaproteobacteria bacterium]|nr:hypothetical protein [Alphaproteobacteria bacterium]